MRILLHLFHIMATLSISVIYVEGQTTYTWKEVGDWSDQQDGGCTSCEIQTVKCERTVTSGGTTTVDIAPNTQCDEVLEPNEKPLETRNCQSNSCTSCSSEYELSAGDCMIKDCTCTGGTAATGAACPAHGSAKCVACSGDRYLSNNACPVCS